MSDRGKFLFSLTCSLVIHFLFLSSKEVQGLFVSTDRSRPIPRELVMEITPPPPKFEAKPEQLPKRKRFVEVPEPDEAPPKQETDLIGLKDSAARDRAPEKQSSDGMPKLDGESSMVALRDLPASVGEATVPAPPASREPQEELTQEPPKPIAPAAPAQPERVPEPTKPVKEPPPEEEKAETVGVVQPMPAVPPQPAIAPPVPEPEREKQPPEPAPAPKPESVPPPAKQPTPEEKDLSAAKRASSTSRVAGGFVPPSAPTVIPEAKTEHPESGTEEKGEPAFNIKMHEYAEYYKHIRDRIGLMWEIQHSGDYVLGPVRDREARVVIEFIILRSGEITGVAIADDGGDLLLATAFRETIVTTELNPFPAYVAEDRLRIRYTLYFR